MIKTDTHRILIVGATSAIAQAAARRWAARGAVFYLVARSPEKMATVAADLKVRGAGTLTTELLDVNALDRHKEVIDRAALVLGGLDIALIAHGSLGDQESGERDFTVAIQELHTNAISVLSLATHIANHLQAQGSGCLAVIGSVAGDRGRQSNYIYGAAKGSVSIFLQGMRQRLHKHGVRVLTIKPGFVDTPMTANIAKGLLWASSDRVAKDIVAAIDGRRLVIYTPYFWSLIMLIIRLIPEQIFTRLRL